MSEHLEHDGAAAVDGPEGLDGARLLEQGRAARQERARSRTLKARLQSIMADRPSWLRITVLAAAAVLAVMVLLVLLDVTVSFGRVHPGVRVADVRVGAMSPERAAEAVTEGIQPRFDDPVTLRFEERSWDLTGETVGATLDAQESVALAMEVGRTGSVWDRIGTRAKLWFQPQAVPVVVRGDDELLAGFLGEISGEIDRDPLDASVVIEGTEARLEPALLGLAVRSDEAGTRLLDALGSTERDVSIPVDFLPVSVTDEGARQALADTQAMLDGPVVVRHAEDSWEFDAPAIAGWIAFRTVPDPASNVATGTAAVVATDGVDASLESTPSVVGERYMLEAYISSDEASATLIGVVGEAGTPAVDARFEVGGGNVTIVPSTDGVGPDIEALAVEMTRVLTLGGERAVELRTQRIEPEITTERAQAMGIKERIATYTTNFSSANRPRVSNIHTLASALDGVLVPPGGTFGFNDTIGPRTAAKGYEEAPTIIGGRLVPSLGGGICQVTTTLFNAVFESGLAVVERRNHSFYISSYPDGRDATVSWGGPDFKFRNDTENWVLVATAYSNTSVTVSLYGTDPGYEVRASTGDFTDIKPHPVKEIKDDSLAAGMRVIEDAGVDGRRIIVKRTVTKGGSLVREDTFTSVYTPKEETVRVGIRADTPTATVVP